ncbi:MAG: hypothetical protein WC694_02840 [Candidatus Paceibacterota bacterium]|jgi:hypothetical protein
MKISFLKIIFVLAFIFCFSPFLASASVTDNMSGYAWSSNIGWISFNCTNNNSCATSNYGVNKDASGNLVGYAWSPNIGWIQFGGLSSFPIGSGTQSINAKINGNNLQGWAKAPSASDGSSGWDGWISLSGAGPNYGVILTGNDFSGYAWGSEVIGWINFVSVAVDAGPIMSGTLTPATSSCVIASGASTCTVNLSWSIVNPVGTPTAITANGMTNVNVTNTLVTPQSGGPLALTVPWGGRIFYLYNNNVLLAQSTVNSTSVTCVAGTSWDETKCAPSICTPTPPGFTGSVSPSSVAVGGAYTLSCDYGVNSWYIFPTVGSGSCEWVNTEGTKGNFNCTAGSSTGTFSNNCVIYNTPTDTDPSHGGQYCTSTNAINSLTVTADGSGNCTDGIQNGNETGIDTGGRCTGSSNTCSDPSEHYLCGDGNPGTNQTSSPTKWSWRCGSTLCSEKKIPGFIEN